VVRISNLRLLKILMENSRIKFTELAKIFGVTETAIRKKIKQFEEKGIIQKYTIEINPKEMGYNIDSLIGIDTEPEYYMKTLELLRDIKETIAVYSSSGDHMILVRIWFKNYDGLMEFIKKLNEIKGVTKVCPATIVDKIK